MGIQMADGNKYADMEKAFHNDEINRRLIAMQEESRKKLTIAGIWDGIVRERLTLLLILCVAAVSLLGWGTWGLYWKEYDQEQLRHRAINRIDQIYSADSAASVELHQIKDSLFTWHWQGLYRTVIRDGKIDSIKNSIPSLQRETLLKSIK